MNSFTPSGAYRPDLDIRCAGADVPGWAQPLAQGRAPNSETWLVIMPRRAGKSWLASAIGTARASGATARIDLRASLNTIRRAGLGCLRGTGAAPKVGAEMLLIDEPALAEGNRGGNDPAELAEGLGRLREAGVIPVVFATPLEHDVLLSWLRPDAARDVIVPPPLNADEVARMAAREPRWAPEVVRGIEQAAPDWLQTPFLLELILQVAEEQPWLRSDIPALARAAVEEASDRHAYLAQVFGNGLTPHQRGELRAGRWRSAGVEISSGTDSGILARTTVPRDPVVAAHLPEILRVHHISDLHIGGSLRSTVDAKDKSDAGQQLSALAGAGTPLDSYLSHVRALAANDTAPHLVVVTGDLVNRPNKLSGEQAAKWLAALRSLLAAHNDLRPDDPRIVLVGGNHDVSWDKALDKRRQARHQWFAEAFDGYPHPDLQLEDYAERRLYVRYAGAGVRLALLGSAESGGEVARDYDRELLGEYTAQFLSADDDSVGTLIGSLERLDPGIVARDVLNRLKSEPGYITIAAIHHPLSAVPAVEVAPYTGILNAGQVKRALVSAGTTLVLHGHTHQAFLAAERLLTAAPGWTIRVAGAATLSSAESDQQNGYNEVLIAREGPGWRLVIRPVRFDGGEWSPQPGVAFAPGAAGECALADLASDPERPTGSYPAEPHGGRRHLG